MLVTFEGLDGSGKSTIMSALHSELTALGLPTLRLSEFSDSPHGDRLRSILKGDKFLRAGQDSNAYARSLEIASDLYHFDRSVIARRHLEGIVVLKDRHLDSVVSCQGPELEALGLSTRQALMWLEAILSQLSVLPAVTFLMEASESTRVQRIRSRERLLEEANSSTVSTEDLEVFRERSRWYDLLADRHPSRIMRVVNEGAPAPDVAASILPSILSLM